MKHLKEFRHISIVVPIVHSMLRRAQQRSGLIAGVLLCVLAGCMMTQKSHLAIAPVSATGIGPSVKLPTEQWRERWGKMPLYFVENRGQLDTRVSFYLQGSDKSVYFHAHGLTMAFEGGSIDLEFLGADPVKPEGRDRTAATYSYFKGASKQWRTGLSTYREIIYRNLWPNIDLIYRGEDDRMKYTFTVRPGGDPGQIRIAYRGAEVKIAPSGELEVTTPGGGYKDGVPISYQSQDGRQVPVQTRFEVEQRQDTIVYGFTLGAYDRNQKLEIDPEIIFYSGFIAGSGIDQANAVVVDASHNAYVTGFTRSTDFPATAGSHDVSANGDLDAFIAKVKGDGSGLEYCLYLGGSAPDRANDIALDSAGNVYIVGTTESTLFPVMSAADSTHNGIQDAFVTKINPSGTNLIYSTFLGGDGFDIGTKIAVNGSGEAYLIGNTSSNEVSFPDTAGAYDTSYNGNEDAFVAAFNTTGSALKFCTYFGGDDFDNGRGIALDTDSNVYITGHTNSTTLSLSPFPITAGVFGPANAGNSDVFVTKLNTTGTTLLYSTFLGGTGDEGGESIIVDSAKNAYVTGMTTSLNFPTTAGAYDESNNGATDTFVTKINPTATAISSSTYYGGSDDDISFDISLDSTNRVCLTGLTKSANLPMTAGSPASVFAGNSDAFVTRFNADGKALAFATFLGGSDIDYGDGIAVDTADAIYVVGYTSSTSFPTRTGPFLIYNDNGDAFITKLVNLSAPTISKSFGAATIPVGGKTTLSFTIGNPNTVALTNLNFIDPLPVGLVVATPANITNTCGGTVTAADGSSSIELANGALSGTSSCQISVDVMGTTTGVKPNISETVKAFESLEGNRATAEITVVAPPSIAKAFGAPTLPMTDPDPTKNVTDLTLTITNPNTTVTLTGVGFTDNLPAGLVIANPNGLSNTCGGTASAMPDSSLVSLMSGVILPLSSCQLNVKVKGLTPGEKINITSNITSIEGGKGNQATATIVVVASPTVTKFFSPNAIIVGNSTKLIISIYNYANKAVTLTGVGLVDDLPSGLIVDTVPVLTSPGCGSPTVTHSPRTRIEMSNATIAAGASCQLTVKVRAATAGYKNNITDPVTSSNGGSGNRASAVLDVKIGPGMTFASYNANDGNIRFRGEEGQEHLYSGQQQAVPLAGDWNGDGKQSFGFFRNGVFHLSDELRADNVQTASQPIHFGQPGDQPVVGDWDGDGVTTIGVYRNGVFYLRNSNTPGVADLVITYGEVGDVPVAGHFNGLGFDTVGIYRGQTGGFHLLQDHSNISTVISLVFSADSAPGAIPVIGDWDGDGVSTIGLYNEGRFSIRNSLTSGESEQTVMWGKKGDQPIAIRRD